MQTLRDGRVVRMAVFFDDGPPIQTLQPDLNIQELRGGDLVEVWHVVSFERPLR